MVPARSRRLLVAVGTALFVSSHGVPAARAEIFDGSGFEPISWGMQIDEVERVIGRSVSRLRNTHSDYEYLQTSRYQYLGCTYELLLNFEGQGGRLSEIVLTHHGGTKAEVAERPCRDGLSRLREKIGPPIAVSSGVQMWRVSNTTVTVMEGRGGEFQIRYTTTKPLTK